MVEFPEVTIVCQYELSRFSGLDVIQACCSHPVVLVQRQLHRGFYPLDADEGPKIDNELAQDKIGGHEK